MTIWALGGVRRGRHSRSPSALAREEREIESGGVQFSKSERTEREERPTRTGEDPLDPIQSSVVKDK